MFDMISRLRRLTRRPAVAAKCYPVSLAAVDLTSSKRALLSYIADAVVWPDDHPGLMTHTNRWESREIARLLSARGYVVDAINWNDSNFQPDRPYDLVLDIDANLQRLAPLLPASTIRILHLTGSYGPFQNQAEVARVAAFEERTGKLYSPKRLVRWVELAERSLRLADACTLLGNEVTLSTYPEAYRAKIQLIPVSGSFLPKVRDVEEMRVKTGREFLWFFGDGAVHKGLDLVLEVFLKHPEWKLHVVGRAAEEKDFLQVYGDHLSRPNVVVHGQLVPSSEEFRAVMSHVFCFIAPSCSEGISPAAVTCLQFGLLPILSRQTGVSLPAECGVYLKNLSSDAVEQAIEGVLALSQDEVVRQTQKCQAQALQVYSRESFSRCYADFLEKVLNSPQRDGREGQ